MVQIMHVGLPPTGLLIVIFLVAAVRAIGMGNYTDAAPGLIVLVVAFPLMDWARDDSKHLQAGLPRFDMGSGCANLSSGSIGKAQLTTPFRARNAAAKFSR